MLPRTLFEPARLAKAFAGGQARAGQSLASASSAAGSVVRWACRGGGRAALAAFGLAALVFAGAGCKSKIGDSCTLSTDCSTSGDRLCDTSQPAGYCTQFNCRANSCPDQAACVMFNSAVPGCGYDDRNGSFGSRISRNFCVGRCERDEDCRAGYRCADPRSAPYNGLILDNDQAQLGCLVIPVEEDGGFEDAGTLDASAEDAEAGVVGSVCDTTGPSVPTIEAGAPGGGGLTPLFPDAGTDGGPDAGDGG